MRCRFAVSLASNLGARFTHREHAIAWAREMSKAMGWAEVNAPDGVIGQFQDGKPTEEFSFLDAA